MLGSRYDLRDPYVRLLADFGFATIRPPLANFARLALLEQIDPTPYASAAGCKALPASGSDLRAVTLGVVWRLERPPNLKIGNQAGTHRSRGNYIGLGRIEPGS
jgi:hypothetical protein